MNIAIIDADIIGRKKHTFPNLACMKISSYHKKCGDTVTLLLSYDDIAFFDKVYISKVFTDTFVDDKYLRCSNVVFGGTGFFYDKAVPLPFDIEHIMPDYTLYDSWVDDCIKSGAKPADFSYYKEYSIGFLTRGCFRKCAFCVNKNYDKCLSHSNVLEFYDKTRPKLCFLDDNFFACANWFDIIQDVKKLGVPFQFKQGLDERLLTDKHIHEIMSWKYDGDFIFAFDNVEDSVLIESKLKRIFELYPNFKKRLKFYLFCGFDKYGIYDDDFWVRDIVSLFYRAFILAKYSALPYVMRFEKVYSSSYSGLYSVIASWCNQPSFFKKMTFRQYSIGRGMSNELYKIYKNNYLKFLADGHKKGSSWRYMEEFEKKFPFIASLFFDKAGDMLLEFGNGNKIVEVQNGKRNCI